MYDGAPAHVSRAVRDVLSNTYHDRRIGSGGPIAWPPRSPDLNPLDLYMRRHLKTLMCATSVDNEQTLLHRTADACQNIRNYPGIFEHMPRSVMICVDLCTEPHGGQFEHLLQIYSFSRN
jgi:hypothetical protein